VDALLASLVNVGPVEVGTECTVVWHGAMTRARVVAAREGTYDVTLWHEVDREGAAYELGFDTSEPVLVESLPRRELYVASKPRQPKFPVGIDGDADLLALAKTYATAKRALKVLEAAAKEIVDKVNETLRRPAASVQTAPLKRLERVMAKAWGELNGDLSRVVDLARLTVECDGFEAVEGVLRALAEVGDLRIVRAKNRLCAAYDAAAQSGGYRDLLLNVEIGAEAHVAEVQITLRALAAIKRTTGHASYELARCLGLNDRDVTEHVGYVSADVVAAVECGILKTLHCFGDNANVGPHFDALARALASPTCALHSLGLGIDPTWPAGRPLADLLSPAALRQLAPRLKFLAVYEVRAGGTLPDELWDCRRLETLTIAKTDVSGTVSPRIADLQRLTKLSLFDNRLQGPVPAEMSRLRNCTIVKLQGNRFSGRIPVDALTGMVSLAELRLDGQSDAFVNADAAEAALRAAKPGATIVL
jgi:hypothetical protein